MRSHLIISTILIGLACDRGQGPSSNAPSGIPPSFTKLMEASNAEIAPRSAPADEGPRPVPFPPPDSTIKEWLALPIAPRDIAVGRLNNYDYDLQHLITWSVRLKQFGKFANRRDIDFDIWSTAIPDGWIAVYKTVGQWCLIQSKQEGWIWVLARMDEAIGQEDERTPLYSDLWKESPRGSAMPPIADPDGYVTYREIEMIEPCGGELLREHPDQNAKSFGLVKAEYLHLISFSGDWVKVLEPEKITWLPNLVQGEPRPLLRVKWNHSRTGWIRWRVHGPISGTSHVLLRGQKYFGYYD